MLEEGVESSSTGVTDDYELPCGYRELKWGPREKQSVLSTTDPSFQPLN